MANQEPGERSSPPARFESWKEIGGFLKRDARTVQRWEKEQGLPVHRHLHSRRSSVYAYSDELEAWWRRQGPEIDAEPPAEPMRRWSSRTAAAVIIVALSLAAVLIANALIRDRQRPRDVPAKLGLVVANGAPLETPGSVAVSPDGTTLYVSDWGAKAIFTVPAAGGTPTLLASLATSGFRGLDGARLVAISPDGAQVYVSGWNSASVFSVSTATGDPKMLASGPPFDRPHAIAASHDGSLLLVVDNYANKLFRMPSEGGSPTVMAADLPTPLGVVTAGATVYFTCANASVYAISGADPRPRLVFSGPPLVRPTGIKVSPDFSTLYIFDDAGAVGHPPPVLYALPVSGGPLERLHSGLPLLFPADGALSPDGSYLFAADAGYGAAGAVYRFDLFTTVPIDIEPGRASNTLSPSDLVSVAILSTPAFDAVQVDVSTARFGPRQAAEIHSQGHKDDVDGDGDLDLLLHFDGTASGLACGVGRASLRGRTATGARIQGTDFLQIADCPSSISPTNRLGPPGPRGGK